MVDLSKWAIWGCKIIKMKIFPWTVLKILVSMHSPFCPIWRTFLPVYNQPSKTVQGKFFILMILHAHIAHLLKSTIEMSYTIILLRSSLQWGVSGLSVRKKFFCHEMLILDFATIAMRIEKKVRNSFGLRMNWKTKFEFRISVNRIRHYPWGTMSFSGQSVSWGPISVYSSLPITVI